MDRQVARKSSVNRIFVNGLWQYATQFGLVIFQIGYSGFSARKVAPAIFGDYALTMSLVAASTLIINSGLSQTIARIKIIDESEIKSLRSYALIIGLLGMVINFIFTLIFTIFFKYNQVFVGANIYGVVVAISPMLSVEIGIYRRMGRFRYIAISNFAATLSGLFIGIGVLTINQSLFALLLPTALAQILFFAILSISQKEDYKGLTNPIFAYRHFGFIGRATLTNSLYYVIWNFPTWMVAHLLGQKILGQKNRGETITSGPIWQIQNILIQTIYPEYRHDIDKKTRAYKLWTNILIALGWVGSFFVSLGALLVPFAGNFLFGTEYSLASELTPYLLIAGVAQLIWAFLAYALEAIGKFKIIFVGIFIQAIAAALSVLLVWVNGNIKLLILGITVGWLVSHFIQVFFVGKEKYIDHKRVFKNYATSSVHALGIYFPVLTLLNLNWYTTFINFKVLTLGVIIAYCMYRFYTKIIQFFPLHKYLFS